MIAGEVARDCSSQRSSMLMIPSCRPARRALLSSARTTGRSVFGAYPSQMSGQGGCGDVQALAAKFFDSVRNHWISTSRSRSVSLGRDAWCPRTSPRPYSARGTDDRSPQLDRGNKMLAPFRFRQIRHRAVVEAIQDRRRVTAHGVDDDPVPGVGESAHHVQGGQRRAVPEL